MRDGTAAVRVALLCSTRDDIDELREVLREAGAETVFEADTLDCEAAAIRAAAPGVVLINLPESSDEHSPLLDELAALPELRVIFNDASITSALSGWDRARWRRHLSAKILGLEGDLPPRPDAAPSLRLPSTLNTAIASRRDASSIRSEEVAAEMQSGLARLADSGSAGPPPSHDWASELDAHGTIDVPLDSLATDGVAQQAMGTGMESARPIVMDDEALQLNDAERQLLGNLQAFDEDGDPQFVPPQTMSRDEQRVDMTNDESAYPGTQVDDFPPNDLGAPLGAADADLRLYEEVTSDEAMPARLEAPQGFADLGLSPLDATPAPAPATQDAAQGEPAPEPVAKKMELTLESLEGEFVPTEGRANFEIDTKDRHVADLSSVAARKSGGRTVAAAPPEVWVLLGGRGSDIGMLELLGELPPALALAFVVMRTDAEPEAEAGGAFPLDNWPEDTALAPGQAVSLDATRVLGFDERGRLLPVPILATHGSLDATLAALSTQFRARLGLMLFEGQGEDGCEGVAAVVANGGVVWSAATGTPDNQPWNARAQSLGALAQQGNALELARKLTGTSP